MIKLKKIDTPLMSKKSEVETIIDLSIEENAPLYISILDAVVLSRLINDKNYCNLLNSLDQLICDSSLLAFLNNLKNKTNDLSYNGPDFFRDFIVNKKYKQLLIGATEEDYLKIKNKSLNKNLHYLDVGFHKDYKSFDYNKIENYINSNNIDIVWVMLGNPKQDYFIKELKKLNNINSVVISSGAAYLFYLDQIKHSKSSFLGLKFLWIQRLIQNPKIQIQRNLSILYNFPNIYKLLK
ncbi:WecB/TagA/CpsF family glycosyltransferase [Flavobacteriaceae bacterium]|nr:WecB/TagA/CpsF family glycosyltransferase [Flavobacteriaceae bacterium]